MLKGLIGFLVAGMMLKKDMEVIVRYLQEHLVIDFGFKDDEVIESLQECISGKMTAAKSSVIFPIPLPLNISGCAPPPT